MKYLSFTHFFSFRWRFNRREYFLSLLFLVLTYLVIIYLGFLLFRIDIQDVNRNIIQLILAILLLPSHAKRFHDLGYSWMYSLIALVPFMQFIVILCLLVVRWNPSNQ